MLRGPTVVSAGSLDSPQSSQKGGDFSSVF